MKLEKANEIFRTKYPKGAIFATNTMGVPKGRIGVMFDESSKIYKYIASSYQELLAKLGFAVLYKHETESYKFELAKLNKEIETGGYKSIFGDIKFTDSQIDEKKKEIARIEKILANSIIA